MVAWRSDDRVLLLSIPSRQEIAGLARVLMNGVLVALGSADEVDVARRDFAEFENVMFLEAAPTQIPWRDGFFTKVVVPPHLEQILRDAAPEIHRVLAPNGEIVSSAVEA